MKRQSKSKALVAFLLVLAMLISFTACAPQENTKTTEPVEEITKTAFSWTSPYGQEKTVVEFSGFNYSGKAGGRAGAQMPENFLKALVPGAVVEITFTSETGKIWMVFPNAETGWVSTENAKSWYADGKCYVPYAHLEELLGNDPTTWGGMLQCCSDGAWEVTSLRVGTGIALPEKSAAVEVMLVDESGETPYAVDAIQGGAWAQSGFVLTGEMKRYLKPGAIIEFYFECGSRVWITMPDAKAGWMRLSDIAYTYGNGVGYVTYESIAAVLGEDVNDWGSRMQFESDSSFKVTSVRMGTGVTMDALEQMVVELSAAIGTELLRVPLVKGVSGEKAGIALTEQICSYLVPGAAIEITYSKAGSKLWVASEDDVLKNLEYTYLGNRVYVSFDELASQLGTDVTAWGSKLLFTSNGRYEISKLRIGVGVNIPKKPEHVLATLYTGGEKTNELEIKLTDYIPDYIPGELVEIIVSAQYHEEFKAGLTLEGLTQWEHPEMEVTQKDGQYSGTMIWTGATVRDVLWFQALNSSTLYVTGLSVRRVGKAPEPMTAPEGTLYSLEFGNKEKEEISIYLPDWIENYVLGEEICVRITGVFNRPFSGGLSVETADGWPYLPVELTNKDGVFTGTLTWTGKSIRSDGYIWFYIWSGCMHVTELSVERTGEPPVIVPYEPPADAVAILTPNAGNKENELEIKLPAYYPAYSAGEKIKLTVKAEYNKAFRGLLAESSWTWPSFEGKDTDGDGIYTATFEWIGQNAGDTVWVHLDYGACMVITAVTVEPVEGGDPEETQPEETQPGTTLPDGYEPPADTVTTLIYGDSAREGIDIYLPDHIDGYVVGEEIRVTITGVYNAPFSGGLSVETAEGWPYLEMTVTESNGIYNGSFTWTGSSIRSDGYMWFYIWSGCMHVTEVTVERVGEPPEAEPTVPEETQPEETKPENTVLAELNPEMREFNIKITDYLPDYIAGEEITVVVQTRYDAAYSVSLSVCSVDPANPWPWICVDGTDSDSDGVYTGTLEWTGICAYGDMNVVEQSGSLQVTDIAIARTDLPSATEPTGPEETQPEDTVLAELTPENREFNIKITDYLPDYVAGEEITVTVQTRYDAAYSVSLSVCSVDSANPWPWICVDGADSNGDGVYTGTLEWTGICAYGDMNVVEQSGSLQVTDIAITRNVQPEQEGPIAVLKPDTGNQEHELAIFVTNYYADFTLGEEIHVVIEAQADGPFKARLAESSWSWPTLEGADPDADGVYTGTLEWTGRQNDPFMWLQLMEGEQMKVMRITISSTSAPPATEEVPLATLQAGAANKGNELTVRPAEHIANFKAKDNISVEIRMAYTAAFTGHLSIESNGWPWTPFEGTDTDGDGIYECTLIFTGPCDRTEFWLIADSGTLNVLEVKVEAGSAIKHIAVMRCLPAQKPKKESLKIW